MDFNFKLIKSNDDIITGDKINWVTWNNTTGGLESTHDTIGIGYSLIIDLQTLSFNELQNIMNNGYNEIKNKSVYKYLTKPVISILENKLDNIKFETEDYIYELQINRNEIWVKTKSPISFG